MGPNDADIISASVRAAGGSSNDNTLDPSKDAELVIVVEAGSAVIGTGGQWQVGIVVKDVVSGAVIPFVLAPTPVDNGHLGSAPWPAATPQATFRYTIASADLALHKGHLCRIYAYLLIGINAANYDASFVESEYFLVLP